MTIKAVAEKAGKIIISAGKYGTALGGIAMGLAGIVNVANAIKDFSEKRRVEKAAKAEAEEPDFDVEVLITPETADTTVDEDQNEMVK